MIKTHHYFAFVAAFILLAIYGLFVFPLVDIRNLDWPIFSGHAEGLSLVTYGKWRALSFEYLLTDSFSGEFTVGYNFVSDYLLNILSDFLNIPSIVVHSVIMGPLMGFVFVLLNYYYIYKIYRLPFVALISSVLIAFTADSTLLGLFFDNGEQIRSLVHVPFFSLHLATSQSMGWILLIPTLGSVFLAFQDDRVAPKIIAGAFIALLLQSHSLTFINAVTVIALFLSMQSFAYRVSEKHLYRAAAFLILVFLVIAFFMSGSITAFHIIGCCAAMAFLSFIFYPSKWRFYTIVGTTASLVISPYGLFVLSNIDSFTGYEQAVGRVVNLRTIVVYFLPHLLLGLYLIILKVKQREFSLGSKDAWLICFLIATAVLSQNHLFGWHNHPYRFTINLIFPLSIVSAFALYKAWEARHYIIILLGFMFFGVMIQTELCHVLEDGKMKYGRVIKGDIRLANYLGYIRANTDPDKYLMLSAEYRYPRGTSLNSLVMSYSNSRAFLPDYRYIFWHNKYRNRLRSFCIIFPDFPLYDRRHEGCDSVLKDVGLTTNLSESPLDIQDPLLMNIFIKALNVEIFAGREEMGESIRRQASLLDWNIDYDNGRHVVASIGNTIREEVGNIANIRYDKEGGQADIYVENSGEYTINILGASLSDITNGAEINGKNESLLFSNEHFGEINVILQKGHNELLIPWAKPYRIDYQDQSDYINFISITSKKMKAGS
jgi:hypothetical protein